MPPPSGNPNPLSADEIEEEQEPEIDGEHGEEIEEDEDEDAEEVEDREKARGNMKELVRRLSEGPVPLRVHDVIIRGNSRTKDGLIEAVVGDVLRSAGSMQELLQAAGVANAKLRELDIFESVTVTLDAGPPELPDTANVVVEVVEPTSCLGGGIGVYSSPGETKSWSLESSAKLKNPLGHGDIWDASLAYGWDQTTELSAGLALPRFKALSTPLVARVSLLTQDWLKFSSYKEQLLGLSLGLVSTRYHNLAYNLTWRTLTDPSKMASKSIRRHLGHSLLSSLKYTYKIDRRDSTIRPKNGYAFISTSQFAGLGDNKFLRYFRQEFDFRAAFPLGFYNSALNLGVAAGIIFPLGKGFMASDSPVSDRFHMGGQTSLVGALGSPLSLLGFKNRGLGPTDLRRQIPNRDEEDSDSSPGRDFLGGDLAVSAFADISFDLPIKLLRESGIHGHAFACAGNLTKLTEGEYKNFTLGNLFASFRSSVGVGLVVPTKLFRMEINYCQVLKQSNYDRGKTGIQFSFSST